MAKAAKLIDEYTTDQDIVEYGMGMLDKLQVDDVAEWSVLFDESGKMIYYKTRQNPEMLLHNFTPIRITSLVNSPEARYFQYFRKKCLLQVASPRMNILTECQHTQVMLQKKEINFLPEAGRTMPIPSMMKILLVSPIRDRHQFTNKGILIPQLALFILQGLTPKKHEVKMVEEEYMPLDLNEECDVIGNSCMTLNAYRAYRIADW